MEKNNKSPKNLFQFLEKLFKYHHNSAVVTIVFRETVKILGITGVTSVIRVKGTSWISHVQLTLKNLLNAYNAHAQTYNELQQAEKYSAVSKSPSLEISRNLSDRQFMKCVIFMLDIVNFLSIFSKVSQVKNISCKSVNDSLQKCLIKLREFHDNSTCGENWKKNGKALAVSLLRVLH